MTTLLPAWSSAVLSDDGRYRYELVRRWDDNGPYACFVMLNPSTADASVDDPTIRRCMGFARREGMAALVVVNLFALRSTDPAALLTALDPTGPENPAFVRARTMGAGLVVAAWGAHPAAERSTLRARTISDLAKLGRPAVCLGRTKAGAPRHPLYVAATAPFEPFA